MLWVLLLSHILSPGTCLWQEKNQSLIRKDFWLWLGCQTLQFDEFFPAADSGDFGLNQKYETFNSCWSWLVNKGCQNWGTWTERVKLMPRCAKSRTWPTHRRCCCSTRCCRCCPRWRLRWWRTLCSGWASPENTHGQHWLQLAIPKNTEMRHLWWAHRKVCKS